MHARRVKDQKITTKIQQLLLLHKHQVIPVGGVAYANARGVKVNCHFFVAVRIIEPELLLLGDGLPNALEVHIIRHGLVGTGIVDVCNLILSRIGQPVVELSAGPETYGEFQLATS